MTSPVDPVRVKRAKIANLVSKGIRLGTGLYVAASVVFFVGFATGFTTPQVWIIVGLMIVGSALLAPALVFNYGVKKAEREDIAAGR
jgi:hypothetical protein